MSKLATYERTGTISHIVMNDGKANVKSIEMLEDLHKAFDQAESDNAVPVLTGHGKNFSAGFNLKVFQAGTAEQVYTMQKSGAELAYRLMSFPLPVVCACNGNAYPMGAFLIMSSDYRITVEGPYKSGMNEVAIGLAIPPYAIAIAKQRLTPSHFSRTVISGEMFDPEEATKAGIFDKVVPADKLEEEAVSAAERLSQINMKAHHQTKLLARKPALQELRTAIDEHITLEKARERVAMRDAAK